MSLKTDVVQSLLQFASAGGGPFTLDVQGTNGRLAAQVTAVDRLACAFEELRLESPALANKSMDELKVLSNRLCQRLSYLLEPIALIETDADTCTTQLRSSPPSKEDDQTYYYEILVRRGGSIALMRYEKQPGVPRVVVPASVTHEVLGRLASDFDEAAGW